MTPIYCGFDGLEITFQGAVPEWILETLQEAKKQAQDIKGDAITKIGKNSVPVLIGETGSRGGFTYRIDTGFSGETWFIVHSNKRDNWNIRVSVKSFTLALYGYDGVKNKIINFLLNDLEATGVRRKNYNDEITEIPLERISRFDYCIDFKSDFFLPDAQAFVAGGRFKKNALYSQNAANSTSTDAIVFSGRDVKYFRVGTMPNRQIVLYDKLADIAEKRKNYWWKIWDLNKSEFKGVIWRLEARAGKKELNNWNLRRFSDFDKKAGNVISGILKDIRYTIPSETDKNVTRWPMHDFWQRAIYAAEEKLQNYISDAKRKIIIQGHKNQLMEQFKKMILGGTLSYTALCGMEMDEIPGVLELLEEDMIARIKENPQKYIKKHQDSVDKYAELQE